ncbi:helix-turn-helix domain-containing protein [Enterococcus sp. DIV0876]|uniref:helix-turn-helix domain-containing protein n=1 Tax=Enterococcus sp. DIV0876 TaxID=2774633 RepID=UPI003D2FBEE2
MNIGKIIKEERTARHLTQEQLASEFFVTRQLISKWENEKSYPDLDQVVKLSEYFSLPLDYLLKEDQAMIKELNLDSRRKKWSKWLLVILTTLSIVLMTLLAAGFWIDPVFVNKSDITITAIEKYHLPEKTVKNQITGQEITLPEDVEYVVHFTYHRPFTDLGKLSGYKYSQQGADVKTQINGYRKLSFKKQHSLLVIRSTRETSSTNPSLNIGKNIYLMNTKKAGQYYQQQDATDKGNIADISDLLFSAEELAALPYTPGTLPY